MQPDSLDMTLIPDATCLVTILLCLTVLRVRSDELPLNTQIKDGIVSKHNFYRRTSGSSNMEQLKWNNALENAAKEWSSKCQPLNGYPGGVRPFRRIGQNFYVVEDLSIDRVMKSWYELEEPDYESSDGSCEAPHGCRHYKMMMQASVSNIGCAAYDCRTLFGAELSSGILIFCYYAPLTGNDMTMPFLVGPACTRCMSGSKWCTRSLCRADCSARIVSCECDQSCQNGGIMSTSNCSCTCNHPWAGPDCSVCLRICQNGGTVDHATCTCNCAGGWYGLFCDSCQMTCEHGGTLLFPGCTCNCGPWWSGNNCSVCDLHCLATHSRIPGRCACQCDQYWTGMNCEHCERHCENGGEAHVLLGACACNCQGAWDGEICTYCTQTCYNGGTLNNHTCSCECPTGWIGDDCYESASAIGFPGNEFGSACQHPASTLQTMFSVVCLHLLYATTIDTYHVANSVQLYQCFANRCRHFK